MTERAEPWAFSSTRQASVSRKCLPSWPLFFRKVQTLTKKLSCFHFQISCAHYHQRLNTRIQTLIKIAMQKKNKVESTSEWVCIPGITRLHHGKVKTCRFTWGLTHPDSQQIATSVSLTGSRWLCTNHLHLNLEGRMYCVTDTIGKKSLHVKWQGRKHIKTCEA